METSNLTYLLVFSAYLITRLNARVIAHVIVPPTARMIEWSSHGKLLHS
jgi:hypothetical protein